MTEYDNFMVYELLETGEEQRVEANENNLQEILHLEQVFVIVKEDVRRIFIWKGAKSPVRKRFISSRVASKLQDELIKNAAFHRCKIVSVDQGDEPVEFLKTFRLESMEVEEKLEDMRYVRNIEKDMNVIKGQVIDDVSTKKEEDQEYYSPALEEMKSKGIDVSYKTSQQLSPSHKSIPMKEYKSATQKLTKSDQKEVIRKILANELPNLYKRQNLIIGESLYGAVSKITNVFGEDVEEKEWEKVKNLPKGIYSLDNYLCRIYFNTKKGIVDALEVLKPDNSSKGKPEMKKTSLKITTDDVSIDKKILNIDIPENHHRENLIIGFNLYGVISKKIEIFGEEREEEEWTLVKKFPKEIISLSSHLFRIYFNDKKDNVDAVEILKRRGNNNSKTTSSKRNLPKIPSSND
ncbi:MAG: hypothetical protein KGD63_00870 [Candidatus Lokiarchaeota archaeon]|nr:hypothetical protein [Candidatus Lokiarchaeota archaeon]